MIPIQITIRNICNSPALEAQIRKKAEKLEQFYDRILSAHFVVELAQKHKHQGRLFHVHIDLAVPGKKMITADKVDEDVYVALRNGIRAVMRQLETHAHRRHGWVKTHSPVMHGYVVRMLAQEGYGFIEGVDGNEYYFSMTNVIHPQFNQLFIGDSVEYLPKAFNEGWHAEHVIKERAHSLS